MSKTNNIDLFQASKEMSERVADFMQKKVWGITLKTRYQKEIAEIDNSIEGVKKLEGSVFAENIPDMIAEFNARKAELTAKYDKQREEEARFSYTDADKALYKAYKDNKVEEGIVAWFETYGLEVDVKTNSEWIAKFTQGMSGQRGASATKIIRSEAKTWTDDRTRNDILKVFYGILSELMLEKGTLKATAIPEDVREAYAPKKNKKNNK